jgi:hypothetical protein
MASHRAKKKKKRARKKTLFSIMRFARNTFYAVARFTRGISHGKDDTRLSRNHDVWQV